MKKKGIETSLSPSGRGIQGEGEKAYCTWLIVDRVRVEPPPELREENHKS